jgi:DNA-binding response OmpR family regulator
MDAASTYPVLYVENDTMVARAVQRVLRHGGFRVQHILGCGAARALAELVQEGMTDPFDIGIFDIDLDDGNGVTLAEELTTAGMVKRSVFFTASTDERVHSRARGLGVVVNKNVGASALLEAIRTFLVAA